MTVHYLEMVDIRKHVAKDLTTLQKALEPAQTYLLSKNSRKRCTYSSSVHSANYRKIQDAASALSINNLPKAFILTRSVRLFSPNPVSKAHSVRNGIIIPLCIVVTATMQSLRAR